MGNIQSTMGSIRQRPEGQLRRGEEQEAPERTPLDGESPEGTPLDGESPEGTPLDGESPERTPLNGESPERTPLDGESPEGTPLDGGVLEQTPLDGGVLEQTPGGAEKSATLWLLDDESLERQEKEHLGRTQVADMYATRLGGVDMVMKVMLSLGRTFVEAALLLRLDGRAGAPRLLGYGAERPMLLLEALPGCNFLHLLQDADAPLSLHLRVVRRVAQHLREMHALDVVHNDVAIPNVVVHVGDDYRLMDVHLVEFTVACPIGHSLAMAAEPEAFPCVAPEVARGGASTPAADVFSLGALLRELGQVKATGDELPQQAQEVARLATQEEPQARPDLDALEELLGEAVAWQKKKEKRKRNKKVKKQKAESAASEKDADNQSH